MQILSALSQLVKEDRILCGCGRFDGSISLLENCVRIECRICGAARDIKSANMSDVQYLAEMDELILDFED
jgi:hypothetical protein